MKYLLRLLIYCAIVFVTFTVVSVVLLRFVPVSFTPILEAGDLEKTGFAYTLSLINGKYKMTILYCLMEFEVVRFNEMKKRINVISFKTLSAMLKELEADGLIHRKEFPQIPPKVEYSLTERGKSLMPLLDSLCEWGTANRVA